MSGGAVVDTATTNQSGFYTVTGATALTTYTLRATKGTAPAYIANARTAIARGDRLTDPGDLSLAPQRDDSAFTLMLEWRNVLTGIYEWENDAYSIDYDANRKYPWPVRPSTMPFALMDSYFGVPYPEEPRDSVEFMWESPGSMTAFPYGRVDDWGNDLGAHAGVVIRQLPPSGDTRYGIKWFSPGGNTRPGAVVSVYRNNALLKRSQLSSSSLANDGTSATGTKDPEAPTVWGLYSITSSGAIRTPTTNPNGIRTDYQDFIHRNNEIRGVRGPSVGSSIVALLGGYDGTDVYNVQLAEGKKYTFKLTGPAGVDYDLALWDPKATSLWSREPVRFSAGSGSSETITYTVPAGKGGRYYVAVFSYGGSGGYKLARP